MRLLIFLLLVSATGYYLKYRYDRAKEYEGLRTSIKTAEDNTAARKAEKVKLLERLQPLRDTKKETEAPDSSPEALEKEVEGLKKGIQEATEQLDVAEADFREAMEATREHAKKQTFPLIKLPSTGQELKDCTITKFSEGVISITHSNGIARVQPEDLPEGWVQKYSLDYISRESAVDKEAIKNAVARATTPALDLSKAKLADVNARLAEVEAQLLSMSAEMRESKRKTDQLERDAYRIALEKGDKGRAALAKRRALIDESKKVDAGRLEVQKRYRKLREEKLELERARVEMSRRPGAS
jgi:hypothetical protein